MAASSAADEAQPEDQVVWLWPCNEQAWLHWCEVQTQWRGIGMGGATGLDYASVTAYLREAVPKRKPRADIFEGIRAAERATLAVWAAARENNKRDC